MKKLLANGSLAIATMILGLVCCEIALRVATVGFEWRNYSVAPPRSVQMVGSVDFDPELGYTPVRNRMDIGFGPIGNRINYQTSPNDPVPQLPDRPILAFGDSFTYGSEVKADESWPAQLERNLGVPVVNAGVGGYGVDQMVLLAERIVPAVKPRLILVSFIPNDIERARSSIFSGVAKPYFSAEDGKLVLRNVPLRPPERLQTAQGGVRSVLGYSYLVHFVLERFGFGSWWRKAGPLFQLEETDPVQVSCLLMSRLKQLSDRSSTPAVVIAQNGWSDFTPGGKSARDQQVAVLDCARKEGMVVVDTFNMLQPLYDAGGREIYYVNGVGHMTAKGNALVAESVAGGLRAKFSKYLQQ